MPRQRKPQNGGTRLGTGRVANTTTSQAKLQTVYRIPTGRQSCDTNCWTEIEILWTSPVRVSREWETIYRISLDESALETLIESMNLDLSSVTLQTINGNVEFTGSITADGTFTGITISATTVNATTGNIDSVIATDVSTATLETSGNVSAGGNLTVTGTSTLTWNVSAGSDLSVAWNLSVTWDTTTAGLTATTGSIDTLTSTDATITWLSATSGDITTLTSDGATLWQLAVTGTSNFTGDVTVANITSTGNATLTAASVSDNLWVTWNTTLNTLTVNGAATLANNASVGGNLSVAGNSTVTGNQTVTGDAIFSNDMTVSRNLNVSGDATITDDLIVNGSTHLKTLETTGSTSIAWNLSVDWSIAGWSNLVVENQIESGSLVTTNITTDNITINGNIALWNDATAPDFVLQDEKWQPNGVTPLDANWKVDPQYLPPVYTTAIVKMWTWVFSNSDTSVVVDADITADSFVAISNYSDIIWDLNEVINVWQLTVVSNQTETGSYKYIIVNPIS